MNEALVELRKAHRQLQDDLTSMIQDRIRRFQEEQAGVPVRSVEVKIIDTESFDREVVIGEVKVELELTAPTRTYWPDLSLHHW